jgi:signal transduction histidine kinase/CheY-like chemotaxis protein
MDDEHLHRRIRKLERQSRILERRVIRVERERSILEAQRRSHETLLRRVVGDLNRARDAAKKASELLDHRVTRRTLSLQRSNEELRNARDAAMKANKAKSSFLANMSHELRTPLNSIIGYSELIQEEAADKHPPPDSLNDVERIHCSARHLLALINDILDLSKIEAGQSELYLERIDLLEFITGIVDTVGPLVERNRNAFVLDIPEAPGPFIGDRTKLRQVLFNLGSNAAKFTEDGEVRLVVRRHPRHIELAVVDSGIGIASKRFSRLFAAFSQAEDSTTRDYGGTGLGLALTHKLCVLMGGDISVESRPGAGSTFTVFLPHGPPKPRPLSDASGELASELAGASPEDAGLVLLIDDDLRAHEQLGALLRELGFEVIAGPIAGDDLERVRADTLALARARRPALVIMDPARRDFIDAEGVHCCAHHGLELLAALQGEDDLRDIPIIVLSALARVSHDRYIGRAAYHKKPAEPRSLIKLVRSLVGARA